MSQCYFFKLSGMSPDQQVFSSFLYILPFLVKTSQTAAFHELSLPLLLATLKLKYLCLQVIRVDRALIMSIRLMPKLGPLKTNRNPLQHGSSRNKAGDVRLEKKARHFDLLLPPQRAESLFIISPNTDHAVYQCLIT